MTSPILSALVEVCMIPLEACSLGESRGLTCFHRINNILQKLIVDGPSTRACRVPRLARSSARGLRRGQVLLGSVMY